MRDNAHTTRPNLLGAPWVISGGLTAALWAALCVGLYLYCQMVPVWLERQAAGDPDGVRQARQDGLRVLRGLLHDVGPAPSPVDSAPDRASLWWAARTSVPDNGLLIAAAFEAERKGRHQEAALWLALEAHARGMEPQARRWAEQAGVSPEAIARARPDDPEWYDRTDLGQRVKMLILNESTTSQEEQ